MNIREAVLQLTVDWGRAWDILSLSEIADQVGYTGKYRNAHVSRALKELASADVIVYEPGRGGPGCRVVVGLARSIAEVAGLDNAISPSNPSIRGRGCRTEPLPPMEGLSDVTPPTTGGVTPPTDGGVTGRSPLVNSSEVSSTSSTPRPLTHESRSEPTGEEEDAQHQRTGTGPGGRRPADLSPPQLEVADRICKLIGFLKGDARRNLAEIMLPDDPPEPYLHRLDEVGLRKGHVRQALDACREVRTMLDKHGRDSYRRRQQTEEDVAAGDQAASTRWESPDDPGTKPVGTTPGHGDAQSRHQVRQMAAAGAEAPTALTAGLAPQELAERRVAKTVEQVQGLLEVGEDREIVLAEAFKHLPNDAERQQLRERLMAGLPVLVSGAGLDSAAPVVPSPPPRVPSRCSGDLDGVDGLVGRLSEAASRVGGGS